MLKATRDIALEHLVYIICIKKSNLELAEGMDNSYV